MVVMRSAFLFLVAVVTHRSRAGFVFMFCFKRAYVMCEWLAIKDYVIRPFGPTNLYLSYFISYLCLIGPIVDIFSLGMGVWWIKG